MFPIFLPKTFLLERLTELFNREIRPHTSCAFGVKEDGEGLIPGEEVISGVIVYLNQKELKELDELNLPYQRTSGKCSNNIQCYMYIKNEGGNK